MDTGKHDRLRILVADDEQSILDLFQEFLMGKMGPGTPQAIREDLGTRAFTVFPVAGAESFDLTLCCQGYEAVEAVRMAVEHNDPFAVAFVDVRLPPGPDGVWVAEQIRSLDPHIQIVVVTAYSDVRARELTRRVPPADKILYLQKPFYPEEIQQFVTALGAKWHDERELRKIQAELETRVEQRTVELLQTNEQLKQEVEERKKAEEALRQSKSKLRVLSSHLLTAQEKERRRISLELHDELGQALTFLKFQLRSIERHLPQDQASLRESCQQTLHHVDGIVENVRRLSRDLSPAMLEDLGLSAAIRCLVEDFAGHYGIKSSVEMTEVDDSLSQDAQIGIFRIFQEALTNIAKHARAAHVSVTIRKEEDRFSFLLKDDGQGFDVQQAMSRSSPQTGLGLAAMDERARMLGGFLEISSEEGRGARVAVTIPRVETGDG